MAVFGIGAASGSSWNFEALKESRIVVFVKNIWERFKKAMQDVWHYISILFSSGRAQITALALSCVDWIFPSFGSKLATVVAQVKAVFDSFTQRVRIQELEATVARGKLEIKRQRERVANLEKALQSRSQGKSEPSEELALLREENRAFRQIYFAYYSKGASPMAPPASVTPLLIVGGSSYGQ